MTAAPVISNSSPLISLEMIHALPILQQLFGTILIPNAVAEEVKPTLPVIPAWIMRQSLNQPVGPAILKASLGRGESEAISLSLEITPRLLILDDRPARRLAQALQLPIIGTLGVLLAAKRKGFVTNIRPLVDGLLDNGFRVAPAIYKQILSDAGENLPD